MIIVRLFHLELNFENEYRTFNISNFDILVKENKLRYLITPDAKTWEVIEYKTIKVYDDKGFVYLNLLID